MDIKVNLTQECIDGVWKITSGTYEELEEATMETNFKGIKIIIEEQNVKQIEDRIFNMLREKEEVLRILRCAEDAKVELKELNVNLLKCYKSLVNNSNK